MIPGRRRWLAGLCLGLLAGPALARVAATGRMTILRRWPTGNRRLAPPSPIDGKVLCAGDLTLALIDAEAPAPIWLAPHELPDGAVFRPRAMDGMAVCAGRHEIGAWSLDNGRHAWRYRARRQIGVPCLHGRQVLFGDGHELVALNLHTGEAQWRFTAVADTLISYAPAASGDTILVGPGDGRLYALSAEDGRPRWVLNHIDDWQYLRQLHVSGDVLVAGSYKEKLYGIDIASGRRLWEFNAGNFINSHHVAASSAYLWSPTGWLYAVDTRSGSVRWRHRTTDYRGGVGNWAPLLAELITLNERLYALDLANVLHVLSTTDGREIARHTLSEPVRPFVLPLNQDRVLFGTNDGDLLLAAVTAPGS